MTSDPTAPVQPKDTVSIIGRLRHRAVDIAEAIAVWRTRLVANPQTQRRAAAFPLTRPIARAKARAVFDLCAGFVYSQVLLACVELDLFERLRDGSAAIDALAADTDVPTEALQVLCEAAVSLELLAKTPAGLYRLGELGAAVLSNPGIAAMIKHHAMFYADLTDPVAALRAGPGAPKMQQFWAYAQSAAPESLSSDDVAEYSELMAQSQSFIAEEVLAAYNFGQHSALLDVGGGQGAFAKAVALKHPDLSVTVFDLPEVAARARATFAEANLQARATAVGGSFFVDAFPLGADVVTLVRVIHDHSDDAARTILTKARAALKPGGTLVLAEPQAETAGAKPIGAAYFGMFLFCMGSGAIRTRSQLTALLEQTGFSSIEVRPTRLPLQTQVLKARAI